MKRIVVASIALAFILTGASIRAQEQELTPRVHPDLPVSGSDFQSKLTVARQLIRLKDFTNAAALLESLWDQDPDNDIVSNLLQSCYSQLQLYPKVELLVRRQLEKFPGNLSFQVRLAELLAMQGLNDSALVEYDSTIAALPAKDEPRYTMVIRSLIAHDFEQKALELIDSARVRFGDSTIYRPERAAILVEQRKIPEAAAEYLVMLDEDSTVASKDAEQKVLELLRFDETSATIEPILLQAAQKSHSSRLLRLISSHYLSAGRFDDAYAFAIKTDSVAGDNGQYLLSYLRQCRDHHAYGPMVRMSRYVQQRYPDTPFRNELLFDYASALTELGETPDALAVYRELIKDAPSRAVVARGLLSIGLIQRDTYFAYDSALIYLDSAARVFPNGPFFVQARRAIPECQIRAGRLEDARASLEQLVQLNLNTDMSEEAAYKLAMIDFYEKKYAAADGGLRKLMVDYPRGLYVNDALQTLMVMNRAESDTAALYDYSNALLFQVQLHLDSAMFYFKRMAGAATPTLGDVAHYLLADMELNQNDTATAMGQIDTLIEKYPDSYYIQFGMKMKGDILAADKTTAQEAAAVFTKLLEQFPYCPFASEVRARLRELLVDDRIG